MTDQPNPDVPVNIVPAPPITSKTYIPAAVGIQTSIHRFGKDAPDKIAQHLLDNPFEHAGNVSDASTVEDDQVITPAPGQAADPMGSVPNFARSRINLTALSQHFNLYFVAYQDKIYVYLPQAAPDILPGPVLILKPGRSQYARQFGVGPQFIPSRYGGYMRCLDKNFPHQVNHLVVGDLGAEEILVLAYDDGDVVTYYTSQIVKFIQSQQVRAREDPSGKGTSRATTWTLRPFFRDTVGISAWGVAIHKQSRLIAVSSNYHEVHVFAFAVQVSGLGVPPVTKPSVLPEADDDTPLTWSGISAACLEHQLRKRDRNWRVILPVGRNGSNMPAVSFWNDEKGNAQMAVAMDINGHLFLLDIWKVGFEPIRLRSMYRHPVGDHNPNLPGVREGGWGVAVLPTVNFLRTESMMDTVGTTKRGCQPRQEPSARHELSTGPRPWYHDITSALLNVEDNDGQRRLEPFFGLRAHTVHAETRTCTESPPTKYFDTEQIDDSWPVPEVEEDEDQRVTYVENPDEHNRCYTHIDHHRRGGSHNLINSRSEARTGAKFNMIIEPFQGRTYCAYNPSELAKVLSTADLRKGDPFLLDRGPTWTRDPPDNNLQHVILRTFATDIELLIPCVVPTPVLCRRVLEQYNHSGNRNPPWDLRQADRACFVHPIPELSVMVVGSQNGRVAILRTTHATGSVHDKETPTLVTYRGLFSRPASQIHYGFRVEWILPRTSDERRRLRPNCCLLGVAVSPLPVEVPVFEAGEQVTGDGARLVDGIGKPSVSPQRWRIILHYMNHTILMYTIQREKPEGVELQLTPDDGGKPECR